MVEQEQKKPEEKSEEKTKESDGLMDKGLNLADRLEAANKRTEELLAKQEELLVKQRLSGKSDAGEANNTPEEKLNKSAQALADEITGAFK